MRALRSLTALLFLSTLAACGDDVAEADAGPPDTGTPDAGPPWPHEREAITGVTRRDLHLARAIVHLHSPLSHDACDGEGWIDGRLADEECLAHLREAACRLHMDALWLTDHVPHVDEVTLERALWIAEGDEAIRDDGGSVIAARWACEDGHRVFVTAGSENEMMPVGLLRHPSEDPTERAAMYEADGAEAADALRAAGGLVFYAHTEGHPLEQLRATRPDGVEIYNTHANVDPNIREEHLGLDRFGFASVLLRFANAASALEPDLSILSFLSENGNALAKWDTLLAEGMRVVGTGGCDAHENTFAQRMPDGERGDSYRRMMVWHTHHLLVRGEGRDALMDALGSGRLYLTFEVFGTPVGFDFVAESEGGTTAEMGDEAPVGATLRVVRPTLPEGFPQDPAPTLRMRILRAAEGGAVEVASGDGALLEHVVTEPGAYRAEVRMVPEHARPYLGRWADELVREVVWIYSNPVFVVE